MWVTSFYTQTLGCMLSSRLSCFPHSALQTLEPERCLWGGGEWERNAVRWKKRRESESEGLLFVRIMPLRCFPRSQRELPGPPPLSKSFLPLFLSSLSLAQGEYPVSSPFIAAEQQTASLKKKKKTTFLCAHFYLPLSNGPFPLRACQIYLILNLLSFSHPFSLQGRLHGWRKHTWLVLFVIWRSHRRRLH